MADFLADNNLCGQTILKIVSQGSATIGTLLHLKDHVPKIFKLSKKADQVKYSEIIMDLSYFACPEKYEARIEKSAVLQDLDQDLRRKYVDVITKFYETFESILRYVTDLNKFIDELSQGYFIQMTLESVLQNVEGKQLLAEALYLYGVMLLFVDTYIEGSVRERIITFYYRCASDQLSSDLNVDEVCKLLRSTGLTSTSRPARYPEDYFSRIAINDDYVNMLIGRLRSDDVYNQLWCYPHPSHRATALATQASMLFIALYFAPKILISQRPVMREITDKFFVDNWVISVYIGFHIHVLEAWESFPAAKEAIFNTVDSETIAQLVETTKKIPELTADLRNVLKDGVLTEENLLEKSSSILNLLRKSNVALRRTMLHTSMIGCTSDGGKKLRPIKELSHSLMGSKGQSNFLVLDLLLATSQLELKVKELFRKLLDEKRQKWDDYKKEVHDRTVELAEVFGTKQPLTRIERNDNLSKWLQVKAAQIESLDFGDILTSGRKIVELIRAFHEILEFHSLESKVQVREWVNEIVSFLKLMFQTGNINEDILVTMQIIGDFGYAWGPLIDLYRHQMQQLIQKYPSSVSTLRAVFLKLASAMDMPLLRLSQAKSSELVSVSSYYSGELVGFVQKVLQIIPERVFSLLHEIIELQTNAIKEIPTRLDKDKIREYSQLESRQRVAELTHDMSLLTEGILMMQTTLVGIIRIEPKTLLENGIRKELVSQISSLLSNTLTFPGKSGGTKDRLLKKLTYIATKKAGIQRSLEYIGDYVHAYGLKIFQEEYARVISYAAEQDFSIVSKNHVHKLESHYQSKDVPLPGLLLDDTTGYTFLGRLAHELILLTDYHVSMFNPSTFSWLDIRTSVCVLEQDEFRLLIEALDISGVTTLDKFISFLVAGLTEDTIGTIEEDINDKQTKISLQNLCTELKSISKVFSNPRKFCSTWYLKIPRLHLVQDMIFKIGQLQFLRKNLQKQLQIAASCDAKTLADVVSMLNLETSLQAKKDCQTPVGDDFLEKVANYSDSLGLYEPEFKVYSVSAPIPVLPSYVFLLTTHILFKLSPNKFSGGLTSRKVSDSLDGMPLVAGVSLLLKQFHVSQTLAYLAHLGQLLNSMITSLNVTVKDEVQDLASLFFFIEQFVEYSSETENFSDWVKKCVPSYEIIPALLSFVP